MKMFRFISLLHMRNYSSSQSKPDSKTGCKMTNGGPRLVACDCVSKCQIMETRDEIDAFIANAQCRVKCPPAEGNCSCTTNCIADMSEIYCIMSNNMH